MKKLLLLLVLFLSFGLVACTTALQSDTNAYITLDINPSIEIITGEDGLVVQVNPLNDDASVMLLDTDFTGKTLEDVIEEILTLATSLGYIDIASDENAIIVTAEGDTEEVTEKIHQRIQNRLEKVATEKGLKLGILKGNAQVSEDFRTRAEELNVSVGKLKLMEVAMAFDETLTYDVAATMSVKELNMIIRENREEMTDFVNDVLRQQYMEQKAEFKKEYRLVYVQAIYDSMVEAEDTVFADLITGTETTVEQIKALYEAYLNELVAVENTNQEQIENNIMNQIQSDTIISGFLQLRQTLMNQLQIIKTNFDNENRPQFKQTLAEQIRNKLSEIDNMNNQLKSAIQTRAENLINSYQGYKFEYNFGEEGLEIHVRYNFNEKFEEIRAKYVELFNEIGIDLIELEELFVDAIEEEMLAKRNEFKQQFEAFKNQMKDAIDAFKNQIREQSQIKKDAYGNRNN